jgi:hypothetical protein
MTKNELNNLESLLFQFLKEYEEYFDVFDSVMGVEADKTYISELYEAISQIKKGLKN